MIIGELSAILIIMVPFARYRLLPLGALLLAGLFPVFAAPLASDYLSKDVLARIDNGEGLFASSSGKNPGLNLAPRHPMAQEMEASIDYEEPSVIVEALFSWQKPHASPGAEEEMLAIYNVLRAVGSLEGIEYYSASRKKMRVLYEYSSLIAGANDTKPLADRSLERIPWQAESLFARQKDTTFGDNLYSITMSSATGSVTQVSTNLSQIHLGILPVASAGNIRLRILVLSVDDAVLFYAVSSAKALVIPGIKATLETSFGNRVAAVYSWFSRQLSAAWPISR